VNRLGRFLPKVFSTARAAARECGREAGNRRCAAVHRVAAVQDGPQGGCKGSLGSRDQQSRGSILGIFGSPHWARCRRIDLFFSRIRRFGKSCVNSCYR